MSPHPALPTLESQTRSKTEHSFVSAAFSRGAVFRSAKRSQREGVESHTQACLAAGDGSNILSLPSDISHRLLLKILFLQQKGMLEV